MSDSRFHILVVDDNPNNRYTLGSLLARLDDCVVVEAESGEEALAATIEQRLDLILLDVQMPGMDGFETARHLKMTGRTRDIPIVFVTAVFKADEFIQRGYTLGAVDYLTKPIDDNLLLNRVRLYQRLWEREERLKAALEELQRNEALLVQQSRLAAMGEMIGAIAHQWRQPLNALAIVLQDLQDAYEFDELDREYLERMVAGGMKQVDYMSKTIDDFRTFFKPDKARENFAVCGLVEEAIHLIQAQLDWHGIRATFRCSDEGETLEGYPGELKQVLLNVIGNAKDAILARHQGVAGAAEGCIAVATEPLPGGGHRIVVEDNGGGIDPVHLERIFDPYFTTKEEGIGTGIGLYMGKIIVEEHMHGRIHAENHGDGARFVIELGGK